MALKDGDYTFIWVEFRANDLASDTAVFNQTELKEVIENGTIGFPEADPLPNIDSPILYLLSKMTLFL